MAASDDIATRIVEDGLPTLLPDTCSIFDIVRIVAREGSAHDVISAISVLDAATSTRPRCRIVRASIIEHEYNDHIESVVKVFEDYVDKQQMALERLNHIARSGQFSEVLPAIDPEMVGYLERYANSFINEGVNIDGDGAVVQRAGERVVKCIPPSKRGKDSFKDCLIFEEYLGLARTVRMMESTVPLVMITSNTSDYCNAVKHVHPDLQREAAVVNLQVCLNWSHAHYALGLQESGTPETANLTES